MPNDLTKYSDEILRGLNSEGYFLSCFKTLDDIEEEDPRWYIENLFPEGQIVTLASDGGVGKTSLAVDVAANRSAGKACFLDPPGFACDPQLVAFLSTEDSVKKKLRRKLREAGADMTRIIVPDFSGDSAGLLRGFKFGTPEMAEFVRHYRPALCIFDPLQGFVPPMLNMGARNAMRDCMAPLVSLGEETGTTFLIICHTNKRKGAYGRDRIADSADLWDISRSVLMLGFTDEQGVRYLSQEKSNYGELQQTRLFSIDSAGRIISEGSTWKRDREYQDDKAKPTSGSSKADCKEWIISQLNNGKMLISDLDDDATEIGFKFDTLKRAKNELANEQKIRRYPKGFGNEKKWWIEALPSEI